MKRLTEFKLSIIHTLAEKYKFYDQDIVIKDIEVSFTFDEITVWWSHCIDTELKENCFNFKEVWKDYKNE